MNSEFDTRRLNLDEFKDLHLQIRFRKDLHSVDSKMLQISSSNPLLRSFSAFPINIGLTKFYVRSRAVSAIMNAIARDGRATTDEEWEYTEKLVDAIKTELRRLDIL